VNLSILTLKASNLPVYTYTLEVKVILKFRGEYYRICENWNFYSIRVASNTPLNSGDLLGNNSCYFGNSTVELIPYLKKKFRLGLLDSLLWSYNYCRVDSIDRCKDFIPVNAEHHNTDCGHGKGTVFINVSCPSQVDDAIEGKLKGTEFDTYEIEFDSPYHWSKLFPEWYGVALVYVGENP